MFNASKKKKKPTKTTKISNQTELLSTWDEGRIKQHF